MTRDELMEGIMALVESLAPVAGRASSVPLSEGARLIGDLGYDSLRLVELALACEERFGARLEVSLLLEGDPTPARIASLIMAARATRTEVRP